MPMGESIEFQTNRHICSGLLPDGSYCTVCAPIGIDRAKQDRERLLRGEVRTEEDYIDPEPTYVPGGGLK